MTHWRKFIASRPHIPYIAPISLWIIVFVIGPLLVIFYFSFLKTSATGQITNDLTLAHYLALLDPNYLTILLRTLAASHAGLRPHHQYCLLVDRLSIGLLDCSVWR
jgi:ABC-type spermidine/putrescine transport system permease subunit I